MKGRRMAISLVVAAIFGIFCAYGTSGVQIPDFQITMPYLATVFYSRLLIGFAIGLAGSAVLLKGRYKNAALRGAIIGAVVSIGISIYGGAEVFIAAGIIYGIVTDLVATRFG
jgi:hypothetical protein